MADQKLTQLTAITAPKPSDIAYLVGDPSGTPVSRKITLEDLMRLAVVVKVKNTSGATAAAKEVGYVNSAGEYKTTTTSRFQGAWATVVEGGANNADIYVARRGRLTLKYTGTAPSAGHFLSLSATAGQAQRETVGRPEIFAVALAAGSGGEVDALLLTQRVLVPQSNANFLFVVVDGSDTIWTGTINGTPTATSVTVTTSTGALDCFAPGSANALCKPLLHNTTRGTARRVVSVSGSTITTESTSDSWANTDALTIKSQTNTSSGAGMDWVDIDGGGFFDPLDVVLHLFVNGVNLGNNFGMGLHPWEAHADSKWLSYYGAAVGFTENSVSMLPLIDRKFVWQMDANGAAAADTFLTLLGTTRAAP